MGNSLNMNLIASFVRLFESGEKSSDPSHGEHLSIPRDYTGDGPRSGKLSPFEEKSVLQNLRAIEGSIKTIVQRLEHRSSDKNPTHRFDNAPPPAPESFDRFKPPAGAAGKPLPLPDSPGPESKTFSQVQTNTHPQFKPIVRGDEEQLNSQVTDEHSFGLMVDRVAKEYGLDPAMFRAQLQSESGAFNGPDAWKTAMSFKGDVDRGDNPSLGIPQISQYFLNGGPWSKGGPGDSRLGGQEVPTELFKTSVVTQLRTGAAMDALHISDNGGNVERGLATYVNGSPDPSNPKAAQYIANISNSMNDPNVEDV